MTQEEVKTFVTAGNATFTLESTKLKKRYTFKISRDKRMAERYLVKVLIGQDNVNDYRYIGLFYEDTFSLKTSTAAHLPHTTPQFCMMQYFLRILQDQYPWPETCKFYPSGKCGCCGRTLTTPESIQRGIGPECAQKRRRA